MKSAHPVFQLRNMFRFALGNLSDFPANGGLPWVQLSLLDRYILSEAAACYRTVTTAFAEHRFEQALGAFEAFSSTLSNFYFTAVKDRLYCAPADSCERRAAQTAIDGCLRLLLPQLAPLLPFLTEEVFAASSPTNACLLEAVTSGRWGVAEAETWQLPPRETGAMELLLQLRDSAATWAVRKGKKNAAGAYAVVRPGNSPTADSLSLALPDSLREAMRCSAVEVLAPGASLPPDTDALRLETGLGPCELFLQLRPKHLTCARCRRATKERQEDELCRRCAHVTAAAG